MLSHKIIYNILYFAMIVLYFDIVHTAYKMAAFVSICVTDSQEVWLMSSRDIYHAPQKA